MPYILNLVYFFLILAVSPWLIYQAVRKGKYREGYAAKLLGMVPRRKSDKPCLWLHAVSVGEVNLLDTLIRQITRHRTDWECVVSTTTMTGMALAKKKYPDLTVFYCPLDFSWAVRTAMRRIRPSALVLAELELWPNLIRSAREAGARVAVINGRLSERSFTGFSRIRPVVARLLGRIEVIAVQDETYADRFRRLGAKPESVHLTGSMKYDGAETDRDNPATVRLRRLGGITNRDIVFLAGSTQDPEESLALAAFEQLVGTWPRLRLILVPRHPDRFEAVARLLEDSGLNWQRRSELVDHPESNSPVADSGSRVLLVDVVGELGAWWGMAQIAFVGGSMGKRGGQNMIEPAGYGAAVCFGPKTHNFRDVVTSMLAHEAAVVVNDGRELREFVRRCLKNPDWAAAKGDRARSLVVRQLGATEQTFHLLANLLEGRTASDKADSQATLQVPHHSRAAHQRL